MSSVYNTEPQPTGSAILHTNYGEISIELFAKQTPLTCRNFLQHALDGYYDNTSFHRLVPGFIVQGGDPTGSGNGGESIYDGGAFSGDLDPWPMDERRGKNAGPKGINFKDEIHSRLKFNRRGLLGMANESMPDTNGSQFFFTLAKAQELDGKNTMFGRVAGDTIYNLAKLGEAEVEEEGERPLYPAKIERVEILVNPFEDMKKRDRSAKVISKAPAQEKKSKKRKGGKQLLSFGDEEGDAEGDALPILKKPKFDTRVVADDGEEPTAVSKPAKSSKKKAEKKIAKDGTTQLPVPSLDLPAADVPPLPNRGKVQPPPENDSDSDSGAPRRKTQLERTNEEIAALRASMKRTVDAAPTTEKPKSALEQLIPASAARGRKRQPGGKEASQTLDALMAFRSELGMAPSEKKNSSTPAATNGAETPAVADGEEGEVCDLHFIINCESCQSWDKREAKEDSDDEGWMNHALSAAADKLGKDLSYRKKAEEELIVIDPREKAQALKEGKKSGRERESNRTWDSHRDQARNAKLAMGSALSGRGAK